MDEDRIYGVDCVNDCKNCFNRKKPNQERVSKKGDALFKNQILKSVNFLHAKFLGRKKHRGGCRSAIIPLPITKLIL